MGPDHGSVLGDPPVIRTPPLSGLGARRAENQVRITGDGGGGYLCNGSVTCQPVSSTATPTQCCLQASSCPSGFRQHPQHSHTRPGRVASATT